MANNLSLKNNTVERKTTPDLDARLALAIESANSQTKRLQEELTFARRECVEIRKQYQRSLDNYVRETNELQRKNGELKMEIEKYAVQLTESNDKIARLQWKVDMLTSSIEEREAKVWKYLLNTKPVKITDEDYKEYEDVKQKAAEYLEANPTLKPIVIPPSEILEVNSALKRSLATLDFDMWPYKEVELIQLLEYMFSDVLVLHELGITPRSLHAFVSGVAQRMNQNPFHNFRHAFTVTQTCYSLIKSEDLSTVFAPLELLALLLSATCHDLDHPGLNNSFQVNAKSTLAILYNDISPLENHHAASAFTLLNDKGCSLFDTPMSSDDYKSLREIVISNILATDMARHFEMVAKFEEAMDSFSWEQRDDKCLVLQLLLKLADVSGELRPWHIAKPWAERLVDEFYAQTDEEGKLGIPVTSWMQRENVVLSQMQVNFIDHILQPMYRTLRKLFPGLKFHMERLSLSRNKWSELYQQHLRDMELEAHRRYRTT